MGTWWRNHSLYMEDNVILGQHNDIWACLKMVDYDHMNHMYTFCIKQLGAVCCIDQTLLQALPNEKDGV